MAFTVFHLFIMRYTNGALLTFNRRAGFLICFCLYAFLIYVDLSAGLYQVLARLLNFEHGLNQLKEMAVTVKC